MKKRVKQINTITLRKSHKYLAQTGLKSLPSGRIDKRYTGIGATTFEITDMSRNSIIVCPTVALASSKAIWAIEKFKDQNEVVIHYLGSNVANLSCSDPNEIVSDIESGKIVKVIAVVDSFVRYFNGILKGLRNKFHLVVDEADTLQIDSRFRPAMEDCLDLYCEFPSENRTMISATWYESVLKRLNNEPLTEIVKKGAVLKDLVVYNIKGFLPYFVGRRLKEQLAKNRDTKIIVAANSFDLIHEIIISGNIDWKDIAILCSNASKEQAAYLKGDIVNGRLPEKKIIFMTSAYFIGIDIEENVIIHVVADKRYSASLLTAQQIFQICGRARGTNKSRYFYFNQMHSKPKVKDLDELLKERSIQYKKLRETDEKFLEEKIKQIGTNQGGCFYRFVNSELKPNQLLVDFRLSRYKTRMEIYGKGSDPVPLLSKYFKVTLSEGKSLKDSDTKVVKVKETIRDYKKDLFLGYSYSPYGWFNSPFVDQEIILAKDIVRVLPEEARPRFRQWCQDNVNSYSKAKLNELMSRVEKYRRYPEINQEILSQLHQEFDEMDTLYRKA